MTTRPQLRPVWLARAGEHGEDEETALSEGLAIIGFRDEKDLRSYDSVSHLAQSIQETDPRHSQKRAENIARQLWTFRERMKEGDVVVLPLKTRRGTVALGEVTGSYEYRIVLGEGRHTRRVNWLRPDVPRDEFQQDLLYSLGAFMTVCGITRNDAEARIAAILDGRKDPGPSPEEDDGGPKAPPPRTDLAQAAHDEIVAFVRARFQSHDLARLVEAVLQAEGFQTILSSSGPDGGADILAGHGPLGLDAPSLCAQVKAKETAVDVTVFRALQGTMTTFSGSQGLLVSWGGFTQAARAEARQHSLRIRLWDQSDLVDAIYRTYERLPAEIQAELPLKRVWMLVHEEGKD